jgi:serine/threonine-protein kinase
MNTILGNGSFINNHKVIELIRIGNIANTYLAKDQDLEEFVIIKQFACQSPDPQQVEKAQELFQREVKILRRLNHDQIPTLIDTFILHNQASFLVQQHIEGETYHECVFERQEEFTEFQVRQFLLDVLKVLIYVHFQGITHRDISPDNIICRKQDKKPVLIDFGCSKQPINQLNSGSSSTRIFGVAESRYENKNLII